MTVPDLRALLDARIRTLEAQQQQYAAQANAAMGGIAVCRDLIHALDAPPADAAAPDREGP